MIQAGSIFTHPYPFVRESFTEYDEDGFSVSPSWRPGVVLQPHAAGEPATVADGLGTQTLTVVSTHKPGRYAERVFYTQKWTDPDGKQFGKGRLRCCSLRKFTTMTHGYRFPFTLRAIP